MAHPAEMAGIRAFHLKLWLIGAAGLNAAGFHRGPFESARSRNQNVGIPATTKVAADLSLVQWVGVIAWGRMQDYL